MKLVIKILNLVYIAIAAVAITCFCSKPFLDLKANYKLGSNDLTELVSPLVSQKLDKEEVKQCIGDKTIAADVTLVIEATDVFHFQDKEGLKTKLDGSLETTAMSIVKQMKDPLHEMAVKIAKKTAKQMISDSIAHKIEAVSSTASAEAMEKAGIDDKYLSDFTEEVYDKLCEKDPTIDKVMEIVEVKMEDVLDKLNAAEVDGFENTEGMSKDMTDTVRADMEKQFKDMGICDEDGNILNIDDAINTMLMYYIDGGNKSESNENTEKTTEETTEGETGEGGEKVKRILFAEGSEEEETKKTEDELNQKLKNKLMQSIDEMAITSSFSEYLFIYFLFTMFLILPWAALAIFSLIRVIRRKKVWTKVWYLFTFAFIQLILGVVLTIAVSKFLPQISGIIPLESLRSVLSTLTMSVTTSSFIPSILYLALIPLTIVYVILAHRVKANYRKEKYSK